MNPSATSLKAGGNKAFSEHLHYLERQQRYLATLSRQLNSYQCVPKTVNLHEQMEELRGSVKKLRHENETLINAIRRSGESAHQRHNDCETQFRKMLALEGEILEYIGKARIHG